MAAQNSMTHTIQKCVETTMGELRAALQGRTDPDAVAALEGNAGRPDDYTLVVAERLLQPPAAPATSAAAGKSSLPEIVKPKKSAPIGSGAESAPQN